MNEMMKRQNITFPPFAEVDKSGCSTNASATRASKFTTNPLHQEAFAVYNIYSLSFYYFTQAKGHLG